MKTRVLAERLPRIGDLSRLETLAEDFLDCSTAKQWLVLLMRMLPDAASLWFGTLRSGLRRLSCATMPTTNVCSRIPQQRVYLLLDSQSRPERRIPLRMLEHAACCAALGC